MFIKIDTKQPKALKKHLISILNSSQSKWTGDGYEDGFFTHKSQQYKDKSFFTFDDIEGELLIGFDSESDSFEFNSIYTGKLVAFILLNSKNMVDSINILECKETN